MSEYFDTHSATWDANQDRVDRANALAGLIRQHVPLNQNTRVLEFGCGTGLLGFNFISEVAAVAFADTSSGMLDEVRRKIREAGVPHTRALDLTTETLGGPYDMVCSLMTLHHIEDHHAQIAALAGTLAPDGHLCLCDLDCEDGSFHSREKVPHNGFAREDIEASMRKSGLEIALSTTGYVVHKQSAGRMREYPVFLIIGHRMVG